MNGTQQVKVADRGEEKGNSEKIRNHQTTRRWQTGEMGCKQANALSATLVALKRERREAGVHVYMRRKGNRGRPSTKTKTQTQNTLHPAVGETEGNKTLVWCVGPDVLRSLVFAVSAKAKGALTHSHPESGKIIQPPLSPVSFLLPRRDPKEFRLREYSLPLSP